MAIKVLKILWIFFGLLFAAAVAIAFMLPAVSRGREPARRAQCKNNFKQILLALSSYKSEYGVFPPAHTVDSDGTPLHSWRTLILPYLGQQKIYDSIDLSKPWDDPANKDAYGSVVVDFLCPTRNHPLGETTGSWTKMTTYMAVVTPDSCMRSSEPRNLSDIEDDRGATLLIVEVPPDSAVHWMAPVDADESTILSFETNPIRAHARGEHVGMVDGSVRFLSEDIPQDKLRALISIAGHESVDDF